MGRLRELCELCGCSELATASIFTEITQARPHRVAFRLARQQIRRCILQPQLPQLPLQLLSLVPGTASTNAILADCICQNPLAC